MSGKEQIVRKAYRILEEELYALPPMHLPEALEELEDAEDALWLALHDTCPEEVAELLYHCATESDLAILAVGTALAHRYDDSAYWKEAFDLVCARLKNRARRRKGYWRLIRELAEYGELGDYQA